MSALDVKLAAAAWFGSSKVCAIMGGVTPRRSLNTTRIGSAVPKPQSQATEHGGSSANPPAASLNGEHNFIATNASWSYPTTISERPLLAQSGR